MVNLKRILPFALIFVFILLPVLYAEQIVQVQNTPPPAEKKGFFASTFGFLKSPIFWWIFAGLIVFILIIVGLFFLIRAVIKYFKSRDNIFYKLRTQRMKLAKIHRRYPSAHWWHTEKNTPIRIVKEVDGKVVLTPPIAYHRGDYTSHEGNIILSMNLRFNNKFLFFPITDLLIIPNKEKFSIEQRDIKGKSIKTEVIDLPKASDIIKFNENEILLYAESVSNIGSGGNEFYVPVLKAKDGKIIDLSLPVYTSLRDIVTGDFLLEQSDIFVKLAKKSMDLNPNLRYTIKAGDTSQNVEVPSSEK